MHMHFVGKIIITLEELFRDKALIIEARGGYFCVRFGAGKSLDCQLDRVDELGNKLCWLSEEPQKPLLL